MTRDEVVALVEAIAKDWDVTAPRVRFRRHSSGAWCEFVGRIRFGEYSMKPRIVIHEMAHHIIHCRLGSSPAGHGPEFARMVMTLYNRYLDVPLRYMRAKATEGRVTIAPAGDAYKPKKRGQP